jgi:hypothetical protein
VILVMLLTTKAALLKDDRRCDRKTELAVLNDPFASYS